jgi:hypothetical protein
MADLKESPIYETNNADLASFLILEGVRLLECRRDENNPRVVLMRFLDAHQNCTDLERVYLNSEYKRYRDINKWLLTKIHQTLRG